MSRLYRQLKYSLVLNVLLSVNALADMRAFTDNAIMELEKPATLETKDRIILHGGGFRLRTPNTTLYPVNIQAPSIKRGCSGIDMTFGSLSFLDSDQFTAFAQNILAAAPGVAFDLALKTLCPSCADTLGKLHAMANQINQMGMGSCQAAMALGNAVEAIPQVHAAIETAESNNEKNWLDSINENYLKTGVDFFREWNQKLNRVISGCTGPGCSSLMFFSQETTNSMLNWMLSSTSTSLVYYSDAFRAMTGDIIITQRPGNDLGKLDQISSIDGLETQTIGPVTQNGRGIKFGNTERLIFKMMGNYTGDAEVMLADGNIAQASFSNGSLVGDFKNKIEAIIAKMENRGGLNTTDIQFLSLFRDPIFDILPRLKAEDSKSFHSLLVDSCKHSTTGVK